MCIAKMKFFEISQNYLLNMQATSTSLMNYTFTCAKCRILTTDGILFVADHTHNGYLKRDLEIDDSCGCKKPADKTCTERQVYATGCMMCLERSRNNFENITLVGTYVHKICRKCCDFKNNKDTFRYCLVCD